jgi:hypothetical protein
MKLKILIIILCLTVIFISCEKRETISYSKVWNEYMNNDFNFSLKYPDSWKIKTDAYGYVIFIPKAEENWEPEKPQDIPKNPEIRIDFGNYVRESFGPNNFPEKINLEILEEWLEKRVDNRQWKNFSKIKINKQVAFQITEIYVPGCEKVIYWRANNLDDLVRINTGCESKYLDEFDRIVNTIQSIK